MPHRDHAPSRTMASTGLCPLSDYGPCRTMASPGAKQSLRRGSNRSKQVAPPQATYSPALNTNIKNNTLIVAQRLTGVSRSLSRRMPPHRADRRGKPARRGRRTGSPTPIQQVRHRKAVSAVPNRPARESPVGQKSGGVKVRRGKSPVRQTRGFPYRHGLRDGFVLD